MKQNRGSQKERGIGLLMTLIAIAILTILGLALTTTGRIAFMISGNAEEATRAGYLAESGLTHGRELIKALNTSDYTALLQAGDGTGCNGDELSAVVNPIPLAGINYGGGTYVVSVCDDPADGDGDPNADSNGTVRVVSVGTRPDGGSATLELTLGTQDLPAVLVDGNLRINAATKIMGGGGAVHTNGNIHLNGSDACAQLHFSTSGSIQDPPAKGNSGAACNETGGKLDVRSGADPVAVPAVDFASLKNNVDYILKNNGKIWDVANAQLLNLPFGGWSWSDPKWEIDGAVNGSYYAENTAIGINDISGTASFVADGYIEVSGSPTNLSPDLTVGTVTYSMVAGYDLKLNGNAATTIEGVFFANHQVDISGNPNINGQVIAADVADVGFPPDGNNLISLSSGWMEFSGNPTITYNGGGGFGGMIISGWREIRN